MKIQNPQAEATEKLCHAKTGDVVTLPENHHCDPFMVCAVPEKGKKAARPDATHGLFDDDRKLFLLNMRTGLPREMPHLSTRVEIYRNATMYLVR